MSFRRVQMRPLRSIALLLAAMLVLAACAADDDVAVDDPEAPEPAEEPEPDDEPADAEEAPEPLHLEMTLSPSGLPVIVANDQGLFDNLELDLSVAGYDQSSALFLAGNTPLGWEGPIDVAEFAAQGEEFRYLSTAGATNMINGVVVRAEDADRFQSIEDLVGETLGNPGLGTGTWATFQVVMDSQFGIDPTTAFDNVSADSGALLALLEGGEIDAALLFSGQSAAALASDQFTTIFSFTEAFEQATGHKMVINGAIARQSWIEENPDVIAELLVGIDRAVEWMKDNLHEFDHGGEYEEFVEGLGWLRDEATTAGIHQLIAEGNYYLTSDTYTQDWVDAFYELIEASEGVLVDVVPAKDEVFFPPN